MKKALAIALIIFGLAAIIGGIIMLFSLKGETTASVVYPAEAVNLNQGLSND